MYISTRDNHSKVSASRAIQLGMVPKGGLFVPDSIPKLTDEELRSFSECSYQQIAEKIISLYLDDFSQQEIKFCVEKAYNRENFFAKEIVPLHKLNPQTYIMELWHGPTAAFKDMALQILPYFLTESIKKVGSNQETVILVATSGDTGKAALEGFKNVPGIKIVVFYPYQGVSRVQELQMSTTDGDNTYVVAVQGNFDDCQTAVKKVFGDKNTNQLLEQNGYIFSSANSINWGRLLPQIVYYFWAYAKLIKDQELDFGQRVNFVVPTGNFGNILASWYAYKMGLPINKLLCASNENNVLTDFFKTGIYNRNRKFKQTNSPSMDILVSSNLERFLFELSNHDGSKITQWMNELEQKGQFKVETSIKAAMDKIIFADFVNEEETLKEIKETFSKTGYTLDTHTAVALKVYENYLVQTGDQTPTIVDATASPFKFNNSVLEALKGAESIENKDEFQILEELSRVSELPIHAGLQDLDKKEVLHNKICTPDDIPLVIKEFLKID